MSAVFTHRDGGMDQGSQAGIGQLLAELDGAIDDEHPDVAVADGESGWNLSVFQSGLVVYENLEDASVPPRHQASLSRAEAAALMGLLVVGDLAALERQPWAEGYGG